MNSSEIAVLAMTYCVSSYWIGWLFSYGLNFVRRLILTAS